MATLSPCLSRCDDQAEVLGAIRDAHCNLAIWQRAAVADFAPLIASNSRDLRFTCAAKDVPAWLDEGMNQGGYGGDAALRHALIDDAAKLANLYCATLDLAMLELRLEVVRTDSCRKFHADYVTARLITTYVGEGTDWLDEDGAARVAAGAAPLRVHRLSTFDVGLFKGKLATDRPAIHRSPPIGDSGATRLLLVLNPAHRSFVDGAHSALPQPWHLA